MMDKITRIIGSIIMTILLYVIPIFATLSFIFEWAEGIEALFTVMSLIELICLFILIYSKAKGSE